MAPHSESNGQLNVPRPLWAEWSPRKVAFLRPNLKSHPIQNGPTLLNQNVKRPHPVILIASKSHQNALEKVLVDPNRVIFDCKDLFLLFSASFSASSKIGLPANMPRVTTPLYELLILKSVVRGPFQMGMKMRLFSRKLLHFCALLGPHPAWLLLKLKYLGSEPRDEVI